MFDQALTFLLLVGLEVVLGIDNLLLISIVTGRLPLGSQAKARTSGLALALVLRAVLLYFAAWLVRLEAPVLWGLSWKSLILIGGGLFLLVKAVGEIHQLVEHGGEAEPNVKAAPTLGGAILQIVALDVVFSIDSIVTAVGLTDRLMVIYAAVLASFGLVLVFSRVIAGFIHRHATFKMLALAFLVALGITLVIEGLGSHVPKGYLYLPMTFAVVVELLHMRRGVTASRRTEKS